MLLEHNQNQALRSKIKTADDTSVARPECFVKSFFSPLVCYTKNMSKILIVGSVLKDVYLELDERQNQLEEDERGVNWLELGFNGTAHNYFHRTSVYGGAAVSLSVLNKLGIEASILSSRTEFKNGELKWVDNPAGYRYIFSCKGGITYFVPGERKPTEWSTPSSAQSNPDWILVDRSTTVSARLVDELKNFLKFSQGTKLAVHTEKYPTPLGRRLAEMADLLFVEEEPPVHTEEKIVDKLELDQPDRQLTCHISPRKIALSDAEESWSLDRADMMTHLTVYSTITATVLGVLSAGGTPADALLWARLNAEQATLQESLGAEKLQKLAQTEQAKRDNLKLIARSLMSGGKGVLAIDESRQTLAKRLAKFDIPNTHKNRHALYRLMLGLPELRNSISGVIMSEEVAKLKIDGQKSALELLTKLGIVPGVKVDLGLTKMAASDETVTLGREGLPERLRAYYNDGFRFAKWRAAFKIGKDQPSFFALEENAADLAHFARECQLVGLVPIVEPEVLAEGDFPIEKSAEVTAKVLETVFEKLAERQVDLRGCILKCNMVVAGTEAAEPATPNAVGLATAAILRHAVPRYLGGVLLLSGGQEAKMATKYLTAVMQNSPFPWPISFAFSRAFEEPILATWQGDPERQKAAQATFLRHLLANVDALHYAKIEVASIGQRSGRINVVDLS